MTWHRFKDFDGSKLVTGHRFNNFDCRKVVIGHRFSAAEGGDENFER